MVVIERTSEEALMSDILSASEKGVSWRELIGVARRHGVSVNRMRKIIGYLVRTGVLVELKCRVFIKKETAESLDREVLAELVAEVIARSGMKKCGKPLSSPSLCVEVYVGKSGRVLVKPRTSGEC